MQECFQGIMIEILMFLGILTLGVIWILHYFDHGEIFSSLLIRIANIKPPSKAKIEIAKHFPSRHILWLIIVLLSILIVDLVITNIPDQTYGLLVDGFAAWLLASEIFIQEQDVSQGGTLATAGPQEDDIRSTAVKTWGALLLVFGFILQIISVNSEVIALVYLVP